MLSDRLDVGSAAYRVGYDSTTQFNREYRRLFGSPPKRDVLGLLNAFSR
jgi:AraC-like DNA-binding protein